MLIFGAIRAELLHYMIYSLAEYVTYNVLYTIEHGSNPNPNAHRSDRHRSFVFLDQRMLQIVHTGMFPIFCIVGLSTLAPNFLTGLIPDFQ
jgi:hypothetical protein